MCPILKKLSTNLQAFHEVIRIKDEVLALIKENGVRILEHLLSYLEYQFGTKVAGINYRERADGERISSWTVETDILHNILDRLARLHLQDKSLSIISRHEVRLPQLERMLSLLNPWLIQLDQDASNGTDHQINHLLHKLYFVEHNMANNAMNRYKLDIAEGHCLQCLAYSRRYGLEGEEKTTMIFEALRTYCNLWMMRSDSSSALPFAEEAYNLVVEAYDPVHLQVQEAAGVLIRILIAKGDLYDAERYAQVTYGNLRDKKNGIDQETEVVATGAFNLANVIHIQKKDLIKAEELARESLRIRTLVYGNNHIGIDICCDLLARILWSQGKFGDEMRGLYERCLAFSIRNEGPDGLNTATGNSNIGDFYYQLANKQPTVDSRRKQPLLAKFHFAEALRIRSKVHGSTHPNTVHVSTWLTNVLSELSLI
jgi:hypothetical protein